MFRCRGTGKERVTMPRYRTSRQPRILRKEDHRCTVTGIAKRPTLRSVVKSTATSRLAIKANGPHCSRGAARRWPRADQFDLARGVFSFISDRLYERTEFRDIKRTRFSLFLSFCCVFDRRRGHRVSSKPRVTAERR